MQSCCHPIWPPAMTMNMQEMLDKCCPFKLKKALTVASIVVDDAPCFYRSSGASLAAFETIWLCSHSKAFLCIWSACSNHICIFSWVILSNTTSILPAAQKVLIPHPTAGDALAIGKQFSSQKSSTPYNQAAWDTIHSISSCAYRVHSITSRLR